MPQKISENTEVILDVKTIVLVITFTISMVGIYFTLKSDIELAKDLPEPPVTRTEYDLKDRLVRETIMNTQEKVEENSKKLDKIDEKLYKIIQK